LFIIAYKLNEVLQYEALLRSEFCYILNSRQMGKSSLWLQTMNRLQSEGVCCGVIDLTAIGTQEVTPQQWYASVGDDRTIILWDVQRILKLDELAYACDRVWDYLRTNAEVNEEDRHLCDRITNNTAVFSNMRYSLAWGMGHGAWGMGLPRVPHKPAICCTQKQ
jgi:hypothetical protein